MLKVGDWSAGFLQKWRHGSSPDCSAWTIHYPNLTQQNFRQHQAGDPSRFVDGSRRMHGVYVVDARCDGEFLFSEPGPPGPLRCQQKNDRQYKPLANRRGSCTFGSYCRREGIRARGAAPCRSRRRSGVRRRAAAGHVAGAAHYALRRGPGVVAKNCGASATHPTGPGACTEHHEGVELAFKPGKRRCTGSGG